MNENLYYVLIAIQVYQMKSLYIRCPQFSVVQCLQNFIGQHCQAKHPRSNWHPLKWSMTLDWRCQNNGSESEMTYQTCSIYFFRRSIFVERWRIFPWERIRTSQQTSELGIRCINLKMTRNQLPSTFLQ